MIEDTVKFNLMSRYSMTFWRRLSEAEITAAKGEAIRRVRVVEGIMEQLGFYEDRLPHFYSGESLLYGENPARYLRYIDIYDLLRTHKLSEVLWELKEVDKEHPELYVRYFRNKEEFTNLKLGIEITASVEAGKRGLFFFTPRGLRRTCPLDLMRIDAKVHRDLVEEFERLYRENLKQ